MIKVPAHTPVEIVPRAVNEELVTPVPRDEEDRTLFPPILYDCPDSILIDVAPNAPVAALKENKLLTEAPTPEIVDAVFERIGKNVPVDALERFKFAEVLAKPEVIPYHDCKE